MCNFWDPLNVFSIKMKVFSESFVIGVLGTFRLEGT